MMAQSDESNIKPAKGYIPQVPAPPRSATASHGFFKVHMFVEEEEMIPMMVEKPQDMLTIQRFVAIPKKSFYFRIDLSRAPPEGIDYGCRVYIDAGGLDHRHVFDVAKGVLEDQAVNEESETYENVDEAKADHIFWFGSGNTSSTVRGFYCEGSTEIGFKFGELPAGDEKWEGGKEDLEKKKNRIGIIRFQFSRVEKMVPRKDTAFRLSRPPKGVKDYSGSILFKKGVHLATQPGKRLKTGPPSEDVAMLEREICYESRVYFNDMFGYQDLAAHDKPNFNIYLEPSRLAALPLECFNTRQETRKRFIHRFLTWLQEKRYARVDADRFSTNDGGMNESPVANEAASTTTQHDAASSNCSVNNEAVAVEDMVHFISAALSPAASYIICVGKVHPGNFGEKLVQKRATSAGQRNAFFEEKENGLVNFFAKDPNSYELHKNGRDEQNRLLYSVKRVTEIIIDDSDDDDEAVKQSSAG